MGDRIEVPLELDDLEVLGTELVDGVLEVTVRSTLPAACRACGSERVIGHGQLVRRVRDVPVGRPVELVWLQRRVRCRDCGRACRERHWMVEGPKRATARFRSSLFDQARSCPFSQVAAANAVTAWRVTNAFDDHAGVELRRPRVPGRVISIDESSFARPFGYRCVLFDPIARRPIEMTANRDRAAAQRLLEGLSPEVRDQIETVVIDMWRPFRDAIRDVLGPDVRIVADRFHVQRAVDEAAQKVRRRFIRRTVPTRDNGRMQSRSSLRRFDPKGYNARFIFAARADRLSSDRRRRLDDLFSDYPQIGVAWLMKEAFAAIFDAPDRAEAEARLDTWIYNLDAAGLPELRAVWNHSLRRWRQEILNFHDGRYTNAYAEGFTNRIKVIKRSSYGYRQPDRYRAKVLLSTSPRAA